MEYSDEEDSFSMVNNLEEIKGRWISFESEISFLNDLTNDELCSDRTVVSDLSTSWIGESPFKRPNWSTPIDSILPPACKYSNRNSLSLKVREIGIFSRVNENSVEYFGEISIINRDNSARRSGRYTSNFEGVKRFTVNELGGSTFVISQSINVCKLFVLSFEPVKIQIEGGFMGTDLFAIFKLGEGRGGLSVYNLFIH